MLYSPVPCLALFQGETSCSPHFIFIFLYITYTPILQIVLKILLLSLILNYAIMICLGMVFSCFLWLGFVELLAYVNLYFASNFKFLRNYYLICFCPLLLPVLQGLPLQVFRLFEVVSHLTIVLFFLFIF